MKYQTQIFFFLFIFLSICLLCVWARSEEYYNMVEDISIGVNYYKLLGVSEDASTEEIKRNFRKLALIHHPDKSLDPNASQIYAKLHLVYQILSSPESRQEYDKLLNEGIPWHEMYYGKYMHRYGAPDHDPRYVLAGFILFITVSQYLYGWYRYYQFYDMAYQTPRFQALLKQYRKKKNQKKKGKKKKKSKNKEEIPDDINDPDYPKIEVVGAEKPKWQDLLLVHLVKLPYYIGLYVYYFYQWLILHKLLGRPAPDPEEAARLASGKTKEEWELQKRKLREKEEQMRTSAKAKRMRRFMKNRVAEFYDD